MGAKRSFTFYYSWFCLFVLAVLGLHRCTGFSPVLVSQGSSCCSARLAPCRAFSCYGAPALGPGLSGFSTWATCRPQHVGSSQIKEDPYCVSCIGRWILYLWAIRKSPIFRGLFFFFFLFWCKEMCCQQDKDSYWIWNVVFLIRYEKKNSILSKLKKNSMQ